MKKDYIVSRIEASQNGTPYVFVAVTDPNDYKQGGERQQNPFGPNMIVRCMKCDLQNMYCFDQTYCLTTKRKNELAKNIGIIQTELDKARRLSEGCFEILKEAWHSNNS